MHLAFNFSDPYFKWMTRLHKILLKRVEFSINHYDLISPGDHILVTISGGKDSLSLWQLLIDKYNSETKNLIFYAVHIDPGFIETKPRLSNRLAGYFIDRNESLIIQHEHFGPEAVKPNQSKNPCFLCSRKRRKAIFELADNLNCNKIALAHHRDDVIETLLLNIFYGREISTILPKQPVFNNKFCIIRPLWDIKEKLLINFSKEQRFPICKNPCPFEGKSKRQKIKSIIEHLENQNGKVKQSIFQSLFHINRTFLPVQKGCQTSLKNFEN